MSALDLAKAYADIAEHTRGRCGAKCGNKSPNRCCDAMYCEMTRDFANAQGVVLQPTGHPELLYMGEKGCVVPPHLRPICSVHDCQIAGLGFDPNDKEWTDRYFQLRERIEILDTRFDVLRMRDSP